MQHKNSLFKKQLLYLFVLIPLLATGCKKDVTDTTDITISTWELKSVTTKNKTLKPNNKDYLRDDAYILVFESDSVYKLNTSVNQAGGNYSIPKKGEIKIQSYQEYTKVGTTDNKEKELNQNLLSVFKEVTSYEVLGKTLVFKGSKGEVEFKKE